MNPLHAAHPLLLIAFHLPAALTLAWFLLPRRVRRNIVDRYLAFAYWLEISDARSLLRYLDLASQAVLVTAASMVGAVLLTELVALVLLHAR